MPVSIQDLPHLLDLLDDPSEVVQTELVKALAGFGLGLDTAFDLLERRPSEDQRRAVFPFLAAHRGLWLETVWPACFRCPADEFQLERALTVLSGYLGGLRHSLRLRGLLDGLARDFADSDSRQDALGLANFLFVQQSIRGARMDYENPRHSDLVEVIDQRSGIPISLGCLYILVGRRLDFDVGGCRWPGHFHAFARVDGTVYIVDPYHQGVCTPESSFLSMQGPSMEAARRVLAQPASAGYLIRRQLHSLIQAFHHQEQWEEGQTVVRLLRAGPLAQG